MAFVGNPSGTPYGVPVEKKLFDLISVRFK